MFDFHKSIIQNFKDYLIIFFFSIVSISICSKSSFLYPFNDWMDINYFMTVGKSLLKGMIPYKEIYEQKGPLLYFISAFAARISDTTFIGFWIVECVSAFFFLLFSYKSMRVYIGKKAIFWVPVLACVVYSSGGLSHGGSVEEMCLPIFAYTLYVGIRYINNMKKNFRLEMYLVGVLSACVLWMKFSMLGFFLGWILVPLFLAVKKRAVKEFVVDIGFIVLGVITVTLPILLWYFRNCALSELFQVYFYNNIFIYSSGGVLQKVRHLISGLHLSVVYIPIPLLIAVIGVLYSFSNNKKLAALFTLSGVFAGIFIFSGGQGIQYYPLPLVSLSIIGFIAINDFLDGKRWTSFSSQIKRSISLFVALASIAGMYLFSANTYLMKMEKEEMPQFYFKEIIENEGNPTLLNYGFGDGGFYTACDIYPTCKYFCKYNIQLPEMLREQKKCLSEHMVTFVVTRNEKPQLDGYECIAESSYFHEGDIKTYYLYKVIDNQS